MTGRALVLAKAPVPGRVKTRLGASVGAELAADLAAAALLDTLAACAAAFDECHLALEGDLGEARAARDLRAATAGWQVFPQVDGDLGARLAHAHQHVASTAAGPVVQVGMDTPQLTADDLRAVARETVSGTAVLGPALDGGWWVLALPDASAAHVLTGVPMSTPDTHARTADALAGAGLRIRPARTLRDVDTRADAVAVAGMAPRTRFAAAWRRAEEDVA